RLYFFWVRAFVLLEQGRYEESLATAEESTKLARIAGDTRMSLRIQICAEQAEAMLGRFERCAARGREMLGVIAQDQRLRPTFEGMTRHNMIMALARSGAVEEGLELARITAVVCERIGRTACMLDALASLTFRRGRVTDAARILGRADRTYQERDLPRDAVE